MNIPEPIPMHCPWHQVAGEVSSDKAVLVAVDKELARLKERKERHIRQRKAAYRRMVQGGASAGHEDEADGGKEGSYPTPKAIAEKVKEIMRSNPSAAIMANMSNGKLGGWSWSVVAVAVIGVVVTGALAYVRGAAGDSRGGPH
eukprot:scaffold82207_cov31-Tisochrysis_lutea.AAC.8